MHRSAAFTLLELMVAVTIGMVVMGLAVSSYLHSQRMIKRAEALVRLHRTAGDIAEVWELDVSSLLQHVACNATTDYDGSRKNLVQFTGMVSVRDVFDGGEGTDLPYDTDLAWMRWEWKAAERRLTRARSLPPHSLPWYPREFMAYWDRNSLNINPVIGMRPNPVRTYAEFLLGEKQWYDPMQSDPSTPRRTRIYDLLFLTGVDVDGVTRGYGGFALEKTKNIVEKTPNSLLNNTEDLPAGIWSTLPVPDPRRTLAEDVTDLSLTVVTRSGLPYADSGAGFNVSIDGQTQDGFGDRGGRPDILRLSFTLVDRATDVSQSFTFSAKAP